MPDLDLIKQAEQVTRPARAAGRLIAVPLTLPSPPQAGERGLCLGYVCLKNRLALSQRSFLRVSGPRLDQARMLSIELGNWHSECG